ncbi:MAG: mechanosensitive ion channel family protein [Chlamydiae bacterium]|nr:mechanosensitive ion channel family protein [Chlamydiota bacterium]MBI3266997.1 mechanosensitive ion channel family protein [Chlamydiota bacterium]
MSIDIKDFIPLLVFAVSIFSGLGIRSLVFHFIRKWRHREVDDILLRVMRTPSFFWTILISGSIALRFEKLPFIEVDVLHKIIEVILMFSIAVVISNISSAVICKYGQGLEHRLALTSLTQNISSCIIFSIGFLMILNALDISITPILTALGVGGLAAALALQDTLSNLFSGIYLVLSRNVRPGDYVKLDSGQEGYITDITSRVTKMKTLGNNVIIIPNQKLSQAVLTNFHLPDRSMGISISFSVSREVDIEKVERIVLDEAQRAVEEVKGLVPKSKPSVVFIPGFGESSLDFSLNCQVKEFVDQYGVQHELRKRIFKRFKQEGVEMPFPQRVIHVMKEEVPSYEQ